MEKWKLFLKLIECKKTCSHFFSGPILGLHLKSLERKYYSKVDLQNKTWELSFIYKICFFKLLKIFRDRGHFGCQFKQCDCLSLDLNDKPHKKTYKITGSIALPFLFETKCFPS